LFISYKSIKKSQDSKCGSGVLTACVHNGEFWLLAVESSQKMNTLILSQITTMTDRQKTYQLLRHIYHMQTMQQLQSNNKTLMSNSA